MNTQKMKLSLSSIAVMSAIGLIITAGGCSTSKQNCKDMENYTVKNSYLSESNTKIRSALSDSIADIAFKADKIRIDCIKYSGDSILLQQSRMLSKDEAKILRYLLSDSRNYYSVTATGNNIPVVTGRFMPNVRLTMQRKKQEVSLYFDCGLKQWSVCDKDNKEINRYALVSNEIHRLFCTLMPENEFLNKSFKLMYQQEEEKK